MKTTQKSRKVSNAATSIKKSSTKPQKVSAKKENKEKEHEHKYDTPVAGEDGGTEDQSGSKSKKAAKGKNPGEKSKF
jgi:hypothetical protein